MNVTCFRAIYTSIFILFSLFTFRAVKDWNAIYMSLEFDVTNDTWKPEHCKNDRSLTIRHMGNLGNAIWEYMSLYVASRRFKSESFTPYIPKAMKDKLETVFEGLSIPYSNGSIMEENTTVYVPTSETLESAVFNSSCSNLLLGNYSVRYEDVIKFKVANIKKELRFKPEIVKNAMKTLSIIRKSFRLTNRDVTYVGMHYRGTDYIKHLTDIYGQTFKGPPDYRYYTQAMDYFKSCHRNVIFILITVDYKWLRKNRARIQKHSRVRVNPNGADPVGDLALLSHCNHTIINYGTFGATAAFFNEGTTFVYNLELPLDYRGQTIAMGMTEILTNWHMLPCHNCVNRKQISKNICL